MMVLVPELFQIRPWNWRIAISLERPVPELDLEPVGCGPKQICKGVFITVRTGQYLLQYLYTGLYY